jgi:uncharacterized membrane protein
MPWLSLLATLVDFGGTLVVLATALACLRGFVRAWGTPSVLDPLRLRLADGLVLALSFKTGAGVIRTITVGSLHQFAALFFIIALRFFLARVLKAEAARRTG